MGEYYRDAQFSSLAIHSIFYHKINGMNVEVVHPVSLLHRSYSR